MGFAQAWEIRPVKSNLYNLVRSSAQSGFTQRRKTRLTDLYMYTLDYNEETHKSLRRAFPFGSLWSWNVLVKDYLRTRQSYRDSIGEGVFGHLTPCTYYLEDLDVINILLTVANVRILV